MLLDKGTDIGPYIYMLAVDILIVVFELFSVFRAIFETHLC